MIDKNPFASDAAAKLSPSQIIELYIPNYNYSRFLLSKRNVFLEGERGTGKSIALRYNSLPVRVRGQDGKKAVIDSKILTVYVPCNTTLTHRSEYDLLEDFHAKLISDHFFICNIVYSIASDIKELDLDIPEEELVSLRDELCFSLDTELPGGDIFNALTLQFQKEMSEAEKIFNRGNFEQLENFTRTFTSGVLPLCIALRKLTIFNDFHFSIFIDDAHELNRFQVGSLNSWISYRDNSIFSFKVASTKVERPSKITSSGGEILQDHDYLCIDMELPYQNMNHDFDKLAKDILQRRVSMINADITIDDFFPVHPSVQEGLLEAKRAVTEEYTERYPKATNKQINDYVYKRYRAYYFRNRSAQANLPIYSGVETIIGLSTGVVRNLLEPCFWMYDRIIEELQAVPSQKCSVPPSIQNSVILARSRNKWDSIKTDLVKSIVDCSAEDADHVYNLLNHIFVLFRKRLIADISEPRAVMFTITGVCGLDESKFMRVIRIARKARLLYVYRSSGKTIGARESYYVPNRALLPERGLDCVGQHARVSLKFFDLVGAAFHDREIPFNPDRNDEDQPDLKFQ